MEGEENNKEGTCEATDVETRNINTNDSLINMVEEPEATGKAEAIYDEIKIALGECFTAALRASVGLSAGMSRSSIMPY